MAKKTKQIDFEKLGAFYLGKALSEGNAEETVSTPLLYDAKDLTTHAVCFGMTGSGKTGLCVGLLEEAAIDGIPALIIDPKGDMGNLMLRFPKLRAEDFAPWVDPGSASRNGMNTDAFAAKEAERWKQGIAEWDQKPERIKRYCEAAEVTVFTPRSDAGVPVNILHSLRKPRAEVRNDSDSLRERIQHTASALLGLAGFQSDPVKGMEAVFLQTLLKQVWSQGEDLDLAELVRYLSNPPFDRVGVMDIESFYPAQERHKLALAFNALLASPGFSLWGEGVPLDIPSLLHDENGKPRLAVLSIAHLEEAERMFFVTLVLGELLSWVRRQPGTTALRALLYMDEIAGYFPPSKEPPCKAPMLTLLKQARAYGLGVVLASQNPVDLDYKGLSNAGTWFIGRLSTKQDQARVIDGLLRTDTGQGWSKDELEERMASLAPRTFLMNNVHDAKPVVFRTRWVLSYLRGPMTVSEIRALSQGKGLGQRNAKSLGASASKRVQASASGRPSLPSGVEETFVVPIQPPAGGETLVYKASLAGTAQLHFVLARKGIDTWNEVEVELPIEAGKRALDLKSIRIFSEARGRLQAEPQPEGVFAKVHASISNPDSYKSWSKKLITELYQSHGLRIWKVPSLKLVSEMGEAKGDFRMRAKQLHDEKRDEGLAKLKKKYEQKIEKAEERIRKAEMRLGKEQEQYQSAKTGAWLSVGAGLLGAFFGRKVVSQTNMRRVSSAANSIRRSATQKGDIARAEQTLEVEQDKLSELEKDFEEALSELQNKFENVSLELEEQIIKPRKSDIRIEDLNVRWLPWIRDEQGNLRKAHESGGHTHTYTL